MRKVALLIPVYKYQEGLERSLSALPTEVPLDVVVVDDGSTPPIRLPDLPEPHRGFLLRLDENRGIEHALNHGLAWILERGYEYVARLDAGDIALPGRFAKQLAFLEEHPDYALVGGQVRFVVGEGREVFREPFPTRYEDIRRFMHARNCFIHPAVMMRAEALREVGLYSDRFKAAEDYELFFRITRRFKVANLEEYVVLVEVNPQGISLSRRRRQVLSRLKVMLLYFDPFIKESWLGLVKNTALLFLPVPWIQELKRLLENRRGWL
jgi:glycosyltransferase involved in cell wall biosynthesis